MRRKYKTCQRPGGNCTACPLSQNGHDCQGKPITPIEWHRLRAGLTQQQLADLCSIHPRQIQKVENGEASTGNMAAKNLLAIADALGVDPHKLI